MKKFILSISVVFTFMLIGDAQAGLINYNRRNNTGTPTGGGYRRAAPAAKPAAPAPVKPVAAAPAATIPLWMQTPPQVKTAIERVYDVNRDGKLQPAEVKIYLRSVIETVDAKGGLTVNSDILKEYDKNKDGLISRIEVLDLKRDAQN